MGAAGGRRRSSLVSSLLRAVADPHPPYHLAPQDQLKQLQEILGSLSLQEEKTRASKHHLDQQLNNEAQQSSSLVAQLRATVAEREAKVRQLEVEIGQLSMQVSRALAQPSKSIQYPEKPQPPPLLPTCLHLGCATSYLVPLWPPASIWLPGPLCTQLSSRRDTPDCLPAPHKTCLWLPITIRLTQSSRVRAPASSPSPSPAVAFVLMVQDGGHSASLYVHIPGSGMAEGKPRSFVQFAGRHVTSSCCPPPTLNLLFTPHFPQLRPCECHLAPPWPYFLPTLGLCTCLKHTSSLSSPSAFRSY